MHHTGPEPERTLWKAKTLACSGLLFKRKEEGMAPAEGKPVRVRRYIRFRNGINETVREHGRSKRRWFRWGGKGALQGVREARIENRPPAGAGGLELLRIAQGLERSR